MSEYTSPEAVANARRVATQSLQASFGLSPLIDQTSAAERGTCCTRSCIAFDQDTPAANGLCAKCQQPVRPPSGSTQIALPREE
jgi:hypothetical protein